ncbi:MAG: hypothetical protein NVS4B8_19810 [Herpetosiphon sp.]
MEELVVMTRVQHRQLAWFALVVGLLLTMLAFNGGWGKAYGQTAPTAEPDQQGDFQDEQDTEDPPNPGENQDVNEEHDFRNKSKGDLSNVQVTFQYPQGTRIKSASSNPGSASSNTGNIQGDVQFVRFEVGQNGIQAASGGPRVVAKVATLKAGQAMVVKINLVTPTGRPFTVAISASYTTADGRTVTMPTRVLRPGAGATSPKPRVPAGNNGAVPVPAAIPNTGGEQAVRWPFLGLGVLLLAAGGLFWVRSRRTSVAE